MQPFNLKLTKKISGMNSSFPGKIKWVYSFLIRQAQRFNKKLFEHEIYVLGDSHCCVFEYLNRKKNLRTKFKVKIVPGATALGLANPNSVTDALNQFREFLKGVKKRKRIIFLLGEVDTGFLIWYRSEKYSVSVERETEQSLFNYILFIQECLSVGFKKITVLSVPLPTIADRQDWGEVANKRKEVKASQKEKTVLTLKYNQKLERQLQALGLSYISFDASLLDEKTGVVKKDFLNDDPLDHHLDNAKFSKLLMKELKAKNLIKRNYFLKNAFAS